MPIVETVFKVKDEASKKIKDINKSTLELNKGLMKIGGALAGAFAVKKLYDFGKSTVDLAVKMDSLKRSIAGIDYSLGSFGKNVSWKDAQAQTKAQIETIKKLSTEYGVLIEDALNVRKQLAEPLSFMKLADKTELSALVAAQAAAYGASAEQYADEIDKLFSPAGLKDKAADLFKRLDIGLDLDQLNKLAQTAPNELALRIKEAMKADPALKDFADTFAASSNKLKNSWDGVKQKIGEALIPQIEKMMPQIKNLVDRLSTYISSPSFQEDLKNLFEITTEIAKLLRWAVENPGKAMAVGAAGYVAPTIIARATPSLIKLAATHPVETAIIAGTANYAYQGYKETQNTGRMPVPMSFSMGGLFAGYSHSMNDPNNIRKDISKNNLQPTTYTDIIALSENAVNKSFGNFSEFIDNLETKFIEKITNAEESVQQAAKDKEDANNNKPPKPIPVELDINLKSDIPQYANLNFNSNGTSDSKQIKPNGRGSARLGAK